MLLRAMLRLMSTMTGLEVRAVWVWSCCCRQLTRGRGVQQPHDHLCGELHQRICRGKEAAGQEGGAGASVRAFISLNALACLPAGPVTATFMAPEPCAQ